MLADSPSQTKFELGHVLFIDIVGYSKLLLDEQKEHLRELTKLVLETPQVNKSKNEELVTLPTGDGMALVFRNSPEEPAQCALEMAQALREHAEVRVRMGIHSGPVSEVMDVSGRANIAGAGINMAQRVMDCGDAGHILVSKHVADDLGHYARWRPYLHDLGECRVKHGVEVGVVSLYNDGIGNSKLPAKFQLLRNRRAQKRWGVGAAALILLIATIAAFLLVSRRAVQSILPEKSIAVVPFVNMSGDTINEYFSDGLSEELIGILAKIRPLKIIGRSSSFLFKGTSDDSRTIGKKLGVANLLEGTVRKEGERVRIMAELINAADGRALWTETYDRELKDVFAVQSEIATAVAAQLKVKLFGPPIQSDAAPANESLAAYTALQQGNFYLARVNEEGFRKAIEFYDEAVRLDPTYALAYANLSIAWQFLGQTGEDFALAFGKARSAAQTALSLPPNIAQAHTAMGGVLLYADRNLDAAAIEYRQAEDLAPAAVLPQARLTYLLFTQGRLEEADAAARKGLSLDPLDWTSYLNLGRILIARGRYDEAETVLRKGIELKPKGSRWHMHITHINLLRGKPAAALEEARLEPPGFFQDYAIALAQQAQGDRASADAALQTFIAKDVTSGPFQVATIYALRKEPDEMFTWLQRCYDEHDVALTQLLSSPFIHDYSGDPRFAVLCQKLKLPVPK